MTGRDDNSKAVGDRLDFEQRQADRRLLNQRNEHPAFESSNPLLLVGIEQPSRLDLALIEATMIWPDDEAARDDALATCSGEFLRPLIDGLDGPMLKTLAQISLDAPRLQDVQKEATAERFVHGIIAGRILAAAVGCSGLGMEITMERAIETAIEPYCYRRPEWKLSPKTVNNKIWPAFRPVAHLWAATWARHKGQHDREFPCDLDHLPEFLAWAEAFRRLGETTRLTPKSPKMLRAHQTMRLAPEIEKCLPHCSLEFPRDPAS